MYISMFPPIDGWEMGWQSERTKWFLGGWYCWRLHTHNAHNLQLLLRTNLYYMLAKQQDIFFVVFVFFTIFFSFLCLMFVLSYCTTMVYGVQYSWEAACEWETLPFYSIFLSHITWNMVKLCVFLLIIKSNNDGDRWIFSSRKIFTTWTTFSLLSSPDSIITMAKWLWTFRSVEHAQLIKLFFVLRSNFTLSGYVCVCVFPLCGYFTISDCLNQRWRKWMKWDPTNKM